MVPKPCEEIEVGEDGAGRPNTWDEIGVGDLITLERLYSQPSATGQQRQAAIVSSWTQHSRMNRSAAQDKLPLIMRAHSAFEASHTFGPLDVVLGFIVYYEDSNYWGGSWMVDLAETTVDYSARTAWSCRTSLRTQDLQGSSSTRSAKRVLCRKRDSKIGLLFWSTRPTRDFGSARTARDVGGRR